MNDFPFQLFEEIVGKPELDDLLASGKPLIFYDRLEPSGKMHIAQGIMKTIIVNELTKRGHKFIIWIADWFSKFNFKLKS